MNTVAANGCMPAILTSSSTHDVAPLKGPLKYTAARKDVRLHGARCRDWVDATERKAAAKLDRLETELNGYKTNLIKESIRMGHNDLGDFYYARGDLQVQRR